MNRERARELAPIVKAFGEGEDIQRGSGFHGWFNESDPNFEIEADLFRIKPKPREFVILEHSDGHLSVSVYSSDGTYMYNTNESPPPTAIKVREVL